MPFAPYALPWWFDADPDEIRQHYGIGNRYLLVCNHFWMHKDHETAIRSLAMLHGRRPGRGRRPRGDGSSHT